jgi:phosphatidate phosphatase APP1
MALGVVLRMEDAVQHAVARRLRRAGRPVEIRPFSGFGAGGWVRVGGRVVVGAAKAPARPVRMQGTWQAVRANLSQFVTFEVPYAHVRVDIGGHSQDVSADREGYIEAELSDVPLDHGRHTATLTPVDPPGESAQATVYVPDPAADIAVVSDIDDTIIDSGIAHGVVATVTTAVLRDAATRIPLEGAPALYQALAREPSSGRERPFFYLSTSPWNLAAFLGHFIEQHGFPSGPLMLTDWGPGATGLFRIATRAHKLTTLRRLADHLTDVRFVLLGDSGQEDVEIYTAFALECPGRVAAIYVRRAGIASPAKQQRIDRCVRALQDAEVPFVLADDSAAMLAHAQDQGIAET